MTPPGRLYDAALHTPVLGRVFNWVRWRPTIRRAVRRRRFSRLAPGASWHELDSALRSLRSESHHRVVFGPWTGGLELELLYWLPFVRWAVAYAELDRAQAIAISRAGAAQWYAGFAGQVWDLDRCDPAEIARATEGASTVDPAVTLALWERYVSGRDAVRQVLRRSRHERLPVETEPRGQLAVSLVFGERFPDTPANQALVERSAKALAGQSTADPDPISDLAARAEAVAGSTGLVATWSDTAFLGPLTGVPTIVLRGAERVGAEANLDIAQRIARELDTPLAVVDPERVETHALLLGDEPAGSSASLAKPVPSSDGQVHRPHDGPRSR